MADPLSVSTGIAGLITLADLVFCRTFKYVKDVKRAPKQIAALSRELSHLYGIVNSLHLLALQLEEGILNTTIRIDHVHACHDTLEKIKAIIDKHEGNPSRDHVMETLKMKMNWPFSIPEAKDLLAEVEEHKSTLSLALTADGMTGLLHVLSEQKTTANDIREIRQELQEGREAETRIALSKDNQAILDSVGSIDPHSSHETNLKLRHPGTGHWFTKGDEFNRWLGTPKARLWLHGIPGAGKSVLCSSVIEIALAKSNRDIAVAFFYCDYKDTATQDPSNILGSLAKQIAKQDEQSFEKLQKFYQSKFRDNLPCVRYDLEELRLLIMTMASDYDHIMIIVDGLDECGRQTRLVVDLLASLNTDQENCNIKTLFLSRYEQDIMEILKEYAQVSIAANIVDLRLYVGAEIEVRTRRKVLRIKDQSMKDHIMERLVEGAEGMYVRIASPGPLTRDTDKYSGD